jgi:hypothetical protein
MSLSATLYITIAVVLFSLNMIINIFVLALGEKKELPLSTFLATIFAIFLVVWGITILVTS